MLEAFWQGILVLIFFSASEPSIDINFNEIDLFVNNEPIASLQVSGNRFRGRIIDLTEGQALGSYETSQRYSQVYLVVPSGQLIGLEEQSPVEEGSDGITDSAVAISETASEENIDSTKENSSEERIEVSYAGGSTKPFAIDLTPFVSEAPSLQSGGMIELRADDSNAWILKRQNNRLLLSNSQLAMILIFQLH